jgi:hypothetical protein
MKTPLIAMLCAAALLTESAFAQQWAQAIPTDEMWNAAGISADGNTMMAASFDGPVYFSRDAGSSWKIAPVGNYGWWDCAISSNGSVMYAVDYSYGHVVSTTDGGATWTDARTNGLLASGWTSVSCSADGEIATVFDYIQRVFNTYDAAADWNYIGDPSASQYWVASADSSDGSSLVAVASENGQPGGLYESSDYGQTWQLASGAGQTTWESVAGSSDLVHQVAVSRLQSAHVSADSGVTWSTNNNLPLYYWESVSCSSDGSTMVAVGADTAYNLGHIYTSTNYGSNWVEMPYVNPNLQKVFISADASHMIGFSYNTPVIVSPPPVPSLSISVLTTNVVLSWPDYATNYGVLQNTSATTANWTALTNVPVDNNGFFQVTLAQTNHQTYFRLRGM